MLAEQCGDSCVSSAFTLGSFSVGCLLYERSYICRELFKKEMGSVEWGA